MKKITLSLIATLFAINLGLTAENQDEGTWTKCKTTGCGVTSKYYEVLLKKGQTCDDVWNNATDLEKGIYCGGQHGIIASDATQEDLSCSLKCDAGHSVPINVPEGSTCEKELASYSQVSKDTICSTYGSTISGEENKMTWCDFYCPGGLGRFQVDLGGLRYCTTFWNRASEEDRKRICGGAQPEGSTMDSGSSEFEQNQLNNVEKALAEVKEVLSNGKERSQIEDEGIIIRIQNSATLLGKMLEQRTPGSQNMEQSITMIEASHPQAATWCKPCIRELYGINYDYQELNDKERMLMQVQGGFDLINVLKSN